MKYSENHFRNYQSNRDKNISVIIPFLNEEEGLKQLLPSFYKIENSNHVKEVIFIDDGSTDNSVDAILSYSFTKTRIIKHKRNLGYGAALKTGFKIAIGEYVLIMDSDGQHTAELVLDLIEKLTDQDMLIGARSKKSKSVFLRQPGKKLLNIVANSLSGFKIPDINSGLRIINSSVLKKFIHILPSGFSLTTTITIAMLREDYDVEYSPITTEDRRGRASSVNILKDGFYTLMLILRMIVLFSPLRFFLPLSMLLILAGVLYAGFFVVTSMDIPDGSILAIVSGIIIFFFGILADQIAAIRRELFRE
jgi:glycosyltransferase involved in cell wall biosynthesis